MIYYRHSITKLSKYHFTTSKRVERELYKWVRNPQEFLIMEVWALSQLKILNSLIEKLFKKLGINLLENIILITFHPNTDDGNQNEIDHILLALKK